MNWIWFYPNGFDHNFLYNNFKWIIQYIHETKIYYLKFPWKFSQFWINILQKVDKNLWILNGLQKWNIGKKEFFVVAMNNFECPFSNNDIKRNFLMILLNIEKKKKKLY